MTNRTNPHTKKATQAVRDPAADVSVGDERRVTRSAKERAARTVRRRWLILFVLVLLVVVGILANVGPLSHFRDASARLDRATARVDDLKAKKADQQQQLARLNEAGYLETLARRQLTYARPGEDVYIVTEDPSGGAADAADAATPTGEDAVPGHESAAPNVSPNSSGEDTGAPSQGDGATHWNVPDTPSVTPAMGPAQSISSTTAAPPTTPAPYSPSIVDSVPGSGSTQPSGGPGVLERILSAIRGLF